MKNLFCRDNKIIVESLEKRINICVDFFVPVMTKSTGISVIFQAFLAQQGRKKITKTTWISSGSTINKNGRMKSKGDCLCGTEVY